MGLYVHPQLGIGRPVAGEFDSAYQGELEEEIIGGKDTRTKVKDSTKPPYRWICRIIANYQDPKLNGGAQFRKIGTGLLIGPRHVLTNAHNVFEFAGGSVYRPLAVTVNPGQNMGPLPFGYAVAPEEGFRLSSFYKQGKSLCHDYAVLLLREDLGNRSFPATRGKPLGWWGHPELGDGTRIEFVGSDKLKRKAVHLAGYPGDKCDGIPLYPNAAGRCVSGRPSGPPELNACLKRGRQGNLQYGSRGDVVDVPNATAPGFFLHDADACPSQSGSPVWLQSGNKRILVGIHTGAAHRASLTCAVDTPPGKTPDINRAIHINLSVLENIRRWLKE